jgi:hypothetical protein
MCALSCVAEGDALVRKDKWLSDRRLTGPATVVACQLSVEAVLTAVTDMDVYATEITSIGAATGAVVPSSQGGHSTSPLHFRRKPPRTRASLQHEDHEHDLVR